MKTFRFLRPRWIGAAFALLLSFSGCTDYPDWPPSMKEIDEAYPVYTAEEIKAIFESLVEDIEFEETEGWTSTWRSTGSETYDTRSFYFEEQEDEVKTTVTITRRDGEELLESGRVVIEYPLGEFSEHQEKIEALSEKYIRAFVVKIVDGEEKRRQILNSMFDHFEDVNTAPYHFHENLGLRTHRIDWDYVEPKERVILNFARIDRFYDIEPPE